MAEPAMETKALEFKPPLILSYRELSAKIQIKAALKLFMALGPQHPMFGNVPLAISGDFYT